jgi:probable HAF family extracellular repeat protein
MKKAGYRLMGEEEWTQRRARNEPVFAVQPNIEIHFFKAGHDDAVAYNMVLRLVQGVRLPQAPSEEVMAALLRAQGFDGDRINFGLRDGFRATLLDEISKMTAETAPATRRSASFQVFEPARANALSRDGTTVVGTASFLDSQTSLPALWTVAKGVESLGLDDFSQARAVSADGSVIVGTKRVVLPEYSWNHAFRWEKKDGLKPLEQVSARRARIRHAHWASGVSADGSVLCGWGEVAPGMVQGAVQAIRWTPSSGVVWLGGPKGGSRYSKAHAISADGSVIVGEVSTPPLGHSQAFIWKAKGGMRGLGALPGGDSSQAFGVSSDGSVVVGHASARNGWSAFRWTAATGMQALGLTADKRVRFLFAVSASQDGAVVVGHSGNVAMVWDTTHGSRELADVLSNDYHVGLQGLELKDAIGVSDDGLTIAGNGEARGRRAIWIVHLDVPLTEK